MTPERALDILEGRIPHREAHHNIQNKKKDSTSMDQPPLKEMKMAGDRDGSYGDKNYQFVRIFTLVFTLAGLIVFYLFKIDAEPKANYKKVLMERTVSTKGHSLSTAQNIIGVQGQQIKRLQVDLGRSNARIIRLSQSLKAVQESISGKTGDLAKMEQDRDQALAAAADKEHQLGKLRQELNKSNVKPAQLPQVKVVTGQIKNDALKQSSQNHDAISEYNNAIKLNPDNVSAYISRGLAYEDEHNYDNAIADFNKAIVIAPGSIEAYTARGMAYEAKGIYPKAINDLHKALKINPKYSLCFYRLGDIFYLKGNYSHAIANWKKAMKLDSQNDSSRITYYKNGNYDSIISDNTNVIKVYPGYTLAYYKRGAAFGAKGDHDKAIADLSKAIELNPKYVDAYNDRAVAYFFKHEYDKALEDVKKVQELGGVVNADFINSLKTVLGKADGTSV